MVTKKELQNLRLEIKSRHKTLLNQTEMGFGEHQKWNLLRGIIMDCFGTQGIDGLLQDLIERLDGGTHENKPYK
jgi:hypothetical protein